MSVARTTEIFATSSKSFKDAIQIGIARATETLDTVKGAWIKDQEVQIKNDEIAEYEVHMLMTFVLKDGFCPSQMAMIGRPP